MDRENDPTADLSSAEAEKQSMDWLAVLAADLKRAKAKKRKLKQLIQRREEHIQDLIHKEAKYKKMLSKIAVGISLAEEIIDNSSIAIKAAEREIEQ
jgi:hypothetical protein